MLAVLVLGGFALTLEEALKQKSDGIQKPIIVEKFQEESISFEIDEEWLKEQKHAPHALEEAAISFKQNTSQIEEGVDKQIRNIFFVPKKIKVKSRILDGSSIKTFFIYEFEKE